MPVLEMFHPVRPRAATFHLAAPPQPPTDERGRWILGRIGQAFVLTDPLPELDGRQIGFVRGAFTETVRRAMADPLHFPVGRCPPPVRLTVGHRGRTLCSTYYDRALILTAAHEGRTVHLAIDCW